MNQSLQKHKEFQIKKVTKILNQSKILKMHHKSIVSLIKFLKIKSNQLLSREPKEKKAVKHNHRICERIVAQELVIRLSKGLIIH
jgi:hypothetical protein